MHGTGLVNFGKLTLVLYADDILLIAHSICQLEILLHLCEQEYLTG